MSLNTQGLTPRQAEALTFIIAFQRDRLISPSVREIARGIGASSNSTVQRLLEGLRERGRIVWRPGLSRSIEIVAAPPAAYVLRTETQARLLRYCAAMNERATDVVDDAVALHLDTLGVA